MTVTSLTASAILAHPGHGETSVLVDAGGVWDDVAVEADEHDLLPVDVPTIAVLVAPAPRDEWRAEAMLRRLRDRGYRALAMPWPHAPSPHTIAVARRLGMTLLDTRRPTGLARACWQLLDGQDALSLAYVRRAAASIEYTARDLTDLLRHLAHGLSCGVTIIDRQGILRSEGEAPSQALVDGVDRDASWLQDVVRGDEHAVSVRVDDPTRPDTRLVFSGRGWSRPQRRAVAAAAEISMPAVAARLLIDEVRALSDSSRSSALLAELIERDGDPDPSLDERLIARGWRLDGWHLGLRTVGRRPIDTAPLAQAIVRMPVRPGLSVQVAALGDGVHAWVSFARRPDPDAVERTMRDIRDLHRTLQETWPVATGVGSLRAGGPGLVASLAEAVDVAELAQRRPTTGWFLQADRFGLTQLVREWTTNRAFEPAAAALRASLSADDVVTLGAWLDHQSSAVEAAAALGVHRNTIAPRLRRIENNLGLDLGDADTRLALHIACRIALTGGRRAGS